jgi:aspartate-semialdehyde dehydrogenase
MDKIPVAVLAATGAVGQRFIQLLADHPWFEVTALTASERNVGKRYMDASNWVISGDPPTSLANMILSPMETALPAKIVFSALPGSVAREFEPKFAEAGYVVCSNASAHRMEPDVPLLIPEINADHLGLIEKQRRERGWAGLMVTSPNCTTTAAVMPLKPLHDAFGLQKVFAATLQAISGAGYPGVASLDIIDNIIPYIRGEEEKIEAETCLLLGQMDVGNRVDADIRMSAHANRVPVVDGHTVCLSMEFEEKPSVEDAITAMRDYRGLDVDLPSAPRAPILVSELPDRPQPRRDRDALDGMAATVGRVRPCPLLDLRMVSVVHNTLRGAASGSILNAELLVAKGYLA